ncbi:MAG: RagB/SusD family nutrient uptake outer membrane protein [Mucilaginibacter polytrichastri]|nr:RagB/SusD family nutrient uptake outer membrane protein [Mucilaginibacter polytrichastri]
MKNIFALALFTLLFSACTKLDEDAPFIEEQNFYKTTDDALAAVTGVYSHLSHDVSGLSDFGLYQRQLHLTTDLISDDAKAGIGATNTNVRNLGDVAFTTANDRVEKTWRQHYSAINRANAVIANIGAMTNVDATLKNRLIGETKFIRGLLYFNLVRLWGDVPLITQATVGEDVQDGNLNVKRSPVADVYKQIITDLTDAEAALPARFSGADVGRATQGAAKSILAKVYLTQKDWAKAAAKAQEVITGAYGYDLFPNFADAFNVATKNGVEHIFSVQFKSIAGNANNMGILAAPNALVATPGGGPLRGNEADVPQAGLYEQYSADDKRRDATFYTELTLNGVKYTFPPHFKKYFDPSVVNNPGLSGANFPVIRFSDVLLIYAEALNEQSGPSGDAYTAINRVRTRAGLPALANLSQAQFRDAVYLERRLEFVYESQRWFDLLRTGRMLSELHAHGKPNAQQKHYLLPIPQRELDNNPNLGPQNPGY